MNYSSQRTTRQPHQPTSSERPPTLPDILPPAPSRDHNSRSCPRHPRMSPNPLRLFQPSPAHSWRCDSFQRNPTSPPTRPVPPPFTNSPFHTAVSYPSSPSFRLSRVLPHPLYHYVSLCSVSGNSQRPSIRGGRWVIPARGFLKCF